MSDLVRSLGVEHMLDRPDRVPFAKLRVGDTVRVHFRIVEGTRERVQAFQGVVIAVNPGTSDANFAVRRTGAHVVTTDLSPVRRALSLEFGAELSIDPREGDLTGEMKKRSSGRGGDIVFVAASAPGIVDQAMRATRPGARIVLFAQTSDKERIEISGADICKDERVLCGS